MLKQKAKKIFRKITFLLAAVALLAAGCGGGGGNQKAQPVTLTIWKPFEDTESFRSIVEGYRKLRPNVTVEFVKKNLDTYEPDLLSALAAGNGPDIFSIHNDWLPKYLDKTVPAPDTVWSLKDYRTDFVDALESDFTSQGKIYGTAFSVDSLALYYNKNLLGTVGIAVPPKTWQELEKDVRLLKRSDGKGYFVVSGAALGANTNINRSVDILSLLMLQKGAQSFSADGRQAAFADQVVLNGDYFNPGQEALDFYTSFANPGSLNYNWNLRSDYSTDAFANGRAAFVYGYSYLADTIRSKNPNLNFAISSVPQPNLQQPSVNFANYWGEVVAKQSKNSDYAWDFLKYATSKEALDGYYAGRKVPASRRDLIPLQIQDPDIGVFANANLTAKTFYKPDQQKIDGIFGQMIDNIILKGMDTEEALRQGAAQADAVARERE